MTKQTTTEANRIDGAASAVDAELERMIGNDGLTMEEYLLYLASTESHYMLRNAGLPRGVCILHIDALRRRDYLYTKGLERRDAQGSTCEYTLTRQGNARLRKLREARSNAEVSGERSESYAEGGK